MLLLSTLGRGAVLAQEVPSVVAPPSPLVTPPPSAFALPGWLHHVSLGGGAVLWYYQPFFAEAKSYVTLILASLVIDAKYGRFGLHLEPRFRDSKLRSFFDGPLWVQEAYAHVTLGSTVIKAGKIAAHLGYFWDGSFYGSVQMYDGIKLDFGYGVSVEGAISVKRPVGLRWWAQYFLLDGGTNYSLPGRDTLSISGAHRRNEVIGRLEPFCALSSKAQLRLGLSGEYFQADLPAIGVQNVVRAAADLKLTIGPWNIFGEYLRQHGRSVTEFPVLPPARVAQSDAAPAPLGQSQSSAHNRYYWVGTELTIWRLTARYSFSLADYRDVKVREWIHLPSIGVRVNDLISVVGEFVYWQRSAPAGMSIVDKALVVTLYAHF